MSYERSHGLQLVKYMQQLTVQENKQHNTKNKFRFIVWKA